MNGSIPSSAIDKCSDFGVRQASPFNGGPPLARLIEKPLTPATLFFVRNHGGVPSIDAAIYRLTIDGRVPRPLSLSLDDLRENFVKVTLAATLQCAGNRRRELIAVRPIPGELAWDAEAISTATWGGVRLCDVLSASGADPDRSDMRHVAFLGLDEIERLGGCIHFGGSIRIAKAFSPEVILAYEMNGAPLPLVHGFPLRVVVPGYIGARSVKWLSHITLQATPSDNYFQLRAYRLFPPNVRVGNIDWKTGLMLGEMSITSVICTPQEGARLPAGPIVVQGYALAGGERRVARVDISGDGGETWAAARLLEAAEAWVWRLWEARLELRPGRYEIVVRAVDSAANVQPEHAHSIWNVKGYMNNAWHRVVIAVQ